MPANKINLDTVHLGKSHEDEKTRFQQVNEDRINANFKRLEDVLETILASISSPVDLSGILSRLSTAEAEIVDLDTNKADADDVVPKTGGTYTGDVYGGGLVRSVNTVTPDSDGDVTLDYGTVKSVNGTSPDSDGDVSIAVGTVNSVNGVSPVAGDVTLDVGVKTVLGLSPDANGDVVTARYVGSLSTGGNVSFADADKYTFYAARNSTGYRWFGIHPNSSTSIYMFGYYNSSSYMYSVIVALSISGGKISEPSSTSTYRNTTYQSANNVDIGSLYAIC